MYKPVVLIVLDGWGLGKTDNGNAITKANLPTIEKLNQFYPHIALQASGISVGLPWGEVGNSEVGHITLGAGKIIYQSMPRITMDIQTGEFFKNQAFLNAMEHVRKNNSSLHIMGLVSKGGVHSHSDHLYALLEMAQDQKMEKVFIHAFTDGRDAAPTAALEAVSDLQIRMKRYNVGKIASLAGRYFAMDRNNNWDRIKRAYDAMTQGEGQKITDPLQYLKDSYAKEIYDEFIEPAVVLENDQPVATIKDNDAVIFFNYREDRARQLTKAFVLPGFMKFEKPPLKNLEFISMTQYEDGLPVSVAYPPIGVENPLGKILSQNNLSQLRIAETEKFAHVTYFFNGGNEEAFSREDRVIIPSVSVESFDQAPAMKAEEITNKVIGFIQKDAYDFILINYANADIVGHTGNEEATVKAVEAIDACLANLIPAVLGGGGCLLITADHGNAEELKNNLTGEVDTEHSVNPVPLWFITADNHRPVAQEELRSIANANGLLSDVAPTILELYQIPKPEDMTGESLLDTLK